MRSFSFADCTLTDQSVPIVIAEIGINHNGDFQEALHLADAAIDSGAKYIKIQTHISSSEMSLEAKSIIPQHTDSSIYNIIQSCELTYDEEVKLASHIRSRSAFFLSTPFSLEAVPRVASHKPPFIKIGSGEFNNLPLLEKCLQYDLPLLLSTGMQSTASVISTVDYLRSRNAHFALLHCTNIYPTPDDAVRLGAITQLRDLFPDIIVGLSDHTISNLASYGALALGAGIIERHFTDTKDRIGPDIINSMTPHELSDLLEACVVLQAQRGGSKDCLLPIEDDTRQFAFASVVSNRTLSCGTILGPDDLTVKRPGTGDFPASMLTSLFGRRLQQNVPANQQIMLSHFE